MFRLTDEGRNLAAERASDFAALWGDDTELVGGGIRELGEVLFQVGGAAVQVGTAGSEAQRRSTPARWRAGDADREQVAEAVAVIGEDDTPLG